MIRVNNKDTRTTPTYFTPCSSISIVNFEYVIFGWGVNISFLGDIWRRTKYRKIFSQRNWNQDQV